MGFNTPRLTGLESGAAYFPEGGIFFTLQSAGGFLQSVIPGVTVVLADSEVQAMLFRTAEHAEQFRSYYSPMADSFKLKAVHVKGRTEPRPTGLEGAI